MQVRLVDRAEVFVDVGITSWVGVMAARTLGSVAVLVGLTCLYGLMTASETRCRRDSLALTMQLRSARSVKTHSRYRVPSLE
ncbi:hypothetical protein RHA1_ro08972 (plasmid) [Rhodococcus jostii RHA1]|uniref:FMN-dependent dehydrogenase domain-containing protein n=1 Tax=Rhodococcus jostii (strain RHA1) TaxID=101510 RepID=Q0RXH0_RHOJR|nr:hypothetical protein RHA1_ro08972 [Rhodococcus jostii RHA1]